MNVKELIEILGEYPQEMRVVVQGYEDGYDDLASDQILKCTIALDVGRERWEGMHGDPGYKRSEDDEVVDALVLRRVSW